MIVFRADILLEKVKRQDSFINYHYFLECAKIAKSKEDKLSLMEAIELFFDIPKKLSNQEFKELNRDIINLYDTLLQNKSSKSGEDNHENN